LHVLDGVVMTTRWAPKSGSAKVRFFADRVDVRGEEPRLLPSVNIPGSLLLVDAPSSRIVTADYTATRRSQNSGENCISNADGESYFDWEDKECVTIKRSFKLSDISGTRVRLRQTFTPPAQNIAGVQVSDNRVYISRYTQYAYGGGGIAVPATSDVATSSASSIATGAVAPAPQVLQQGGLWALGGIREGELAIVSELEGDVNWPLAARGSKVALYTSSGLAIFDTISKTPSLVAEQKLRGWGYSSHVLLEDDRAICALDEWGMQTVRF